MPVVANESLRLRNQADVIEIRALAVRVLEAEGVRVFFEFQNQWLAVDCCGQVFPILCDIAKTACDGEGTSSLCQSHTLAVAKSLSRREESATPSRLIETYRLTCSGFKQLRGFWSIPVSPTATLIPVPFNFSED